MNEITFLMSWLASFFSVVVVNCAKPSNWEHCFPVSPWLVPWMHDVAHMYMDGAYHSEKCYLDKIDQEQP